MKKNVLMLCMLAGASFVWSATTDRLWFKNGNVSMGLDLENLDSISVRDNKLAIATVNNGEFLFDYAAIGSATVTASDGSGEVLINYDGDIATIVNPYAFSGVDVTVNGADVIVNADTETDAREVVYHLTGTTSTGSLKVYSTYKLEVLLDNVNITNDNGAAINIQTGKKTTIRVPEGTESTLCDSKKYATPEGEDEKATIFSEGQIEFRAKGKLNITGIKKHAICSDDYVDIKNTQINVLSAASDGIHTNDYFLMQSGSLTMTDLGGDGIDADETGYITIENGTIDISVAGDSNKGLKASGGAVTVKGGDIRLNMSGNSVIKNNDPSYCTAIKAGSDFTMNGGNIAITSTGIAGKGISVDQNAYFNGGAVNIEVSGAGSTYTTTSGSKDSYSATCITVDGDASVLAGDFILNTASAAVGGKCIKVDGVLVIGDGTQGPTINATTRGNHFLVSSSTGTSPGGGGRPGGGIGGGGGWNDNSDYCNPKVIKAVGNMIVNNGTLNLASTATTEGGECLESKSVLSINGGVIECMTYDDCINASNDITINGGNLYCYSTNGDAIDSNGTIHMNGGMVVALGARSPECGIDCDSSTRFTLTGGILVALAGSNNTPSGAGTTQRVVYTTGAVNTTTDYTFTDASGNFLINFRSPLAYTSNANLMVSVPAMTSVGQSIKLYTGATISGGDTFHGLTTNAAYTGGTLKSTLTTR